MAGSSRTLRSGLLIFTLGTYICLWLLVNNISEQNGTNVSENSLQAAGLTPNVTNYLITIKEDKINVCSHRMLTKTVNSVNCSAIVNGNATEALKGKAYMASHPLHGAKDKDVATHASNCSAFLQDYPQCASSSEERDFPIAYSILCHTYAKQVELLLQAIYQPQNVYCLHPDKKSPAAFHQALSKIAACLPNVFIASKLEEVVYASFYRLQAEINCVDDLFHHSVQWKYYINIVGQAFPLKTNSEIVKILKVYNGANDIEGLAVDRFFHDRVDHEYTIRKTRNTRKLIKSKRVRTRAVPGELTLLRGSAYGVFSRQFLHFVRTDRTCLDLLEWSRDTRTPDEHYWASLHHLYHNSSLQGVPGAYSGLPEGKPWLASYSAWKNEQECHGKFVRNVCVFGLGDLPQLTSRHELFANKIYLNEGYLVLQCLGEWLDNRTGGNNEFNVTFYEKLPFIIQPD